MPPASATATRASQRRHYALNLHSLSAMITSWKGKFPDVTGAPASVGKQASRSTPVASLSCCNFAAA